MSDPVVLTVGSLHHDIMVEADRLPRRDETAVGRRWYPKFGGKGGNQAVAVARAGVTSRMLGAVGQDAFGTFLLDGLDAAGVDRRFVASLPGIGSGMSVAVQDPAGDYAATIVSGANLRIDPTALEDRSLWHGVRVLLLQNEVAEGLNRAAARLARMRGLPVVLNAAPARALPDDLAGMVDVLVVNAIEAEMMGTAPVSNLPSALAAAQTLSARFPAVVVTAGAQGLALVAKGANLTLPAEDVQAVSTHGAGDAFTGTLAAELARGADLHQACRAATTAAAAHVAGKG